MGRSFFLFPPFLKSEVPSDFANLLEETSDFSEKEKEGHNQYMSLNFGHHQGNYGQRELSNDSRDYSIVDKEKHHLTTITHEFTHILFATNNKIINPMYKEFNNKTAILFDEYNRNIPVWEDYLGKYASSNQEEFVAECFVNYKLSSNPNKYAKKVGKLIDEYFKKQL